MIDGYVDKYFFIPLQIFVALFQITLIKYGKRMYESARS
jgi:hypothetical protein